MASIRIGSGNSRGTAYLGLGSDVGRRSAWIGAGIRALVGSGLEVSAVSSLWLTEPVGDDTLPWFVNGVAAIDSPPEPEVLLQTCLAVEQALGRERRGPRPSPRILDLDLLLYDARVIDSARLVVPHPRMHLRRFVLEPLCELAPDLVHPTVGTTVARLLDNLCTPERAWLLAPFPGCGGSTAAR